MVYFSNYPATSKYFDYLNALVVGKMKGEMGGIATEELVGLTSKMYSILVSNASQYKKAKGVNKNVVAKICNNGYKDILLNIKC